MSYLPSEGGHSHQVVINIEDALAAFLEDQDELRAINVMTFCLDGLSSASVARAIAYLTDRYMDDLEAFHG